MILRKLRDKNPHITSPQTRYVNYVDLYHCQRSMDCSRQPVDKQDFGLEEPDSITDESF